MRNRRLVFMTAGELLLSVSLCVVPGFSTNCLSPTYEFFDCEVPLDGFPDFPDCMVCNPYIEP